MWLFKVFENGPENGEERGGRALNQLEGSKLGL